MHILTCTFSHTSVPDAGPDNVRSEVLSSVSIAVYWDEVPLINQNGNITMYEVLYVPLQTFGETLSSSTISTTDFETVINGLAPYVSYNISVRAYTVVGAGPYSEPVVNRTLEEGMADCFCNGLLCNVNLIVVLCPRVTFHCSSQCCPWQRHDKHSELHLLQYLLG